MTNNEEREIERRASMMTFFAMLALGMVFVTRNPIVILWAWAFPMGLLRVLPAWWPGKSVEVMDLWACYVLYLAMFVVFLKIRKTKPFLWAILALSVLIILTVVGWRNMNAESWSAP